MKSVYIGIPAYGGVEPAFLNSVLAGTLVLQAAGWDIEYEVLPGCSLITKARNLIADRFLESGKEWLLFLDADLDFAAGDLLALMDRPEKLIGSAYVQKNGLARYNVRPLEPLNCQDGAWEAEGIPTGFMKIHRSVFEAVPRPYCESPTLDGETWGEDFYFCRKYREAGGQVWLLPADIGHVGTYTYRGRR